MAKFETAIQKIFSVVGGYNNDNGISYRGITKRQHAKWDGWVELDKQEPVNGFVDNDLEESITQWYFDKFWDAIQGDKIDNQQVATFLMDWAAFSKEVAVKAVQKIVGAKEDGKFDEDTLQRINAYKDVLINKLVQARKEYLQNLAINDKRHREELPQWLDRVNALK